MVDLNDTYVKRWLTGLAPKSKENYPPMIDDWFTFLGMTPTQVVNKRMNDRLSNDLTVVTYFEDKWREYKQFLESSGTYSDSYVHDRLKVASSFFSRIFGKKNGLSLAKGDWKSTQKQEVKERKWKIDIADIKRMYGHANLRDKCLLLILAQSGFSEVDISELKIEDIQGLYDMPVNEHYVIEKNRDKSVHLQATCLSFEFLHDLRDLLIERGNPISGFIFTSQTKGKDENHINERRINEAMQTLAEKTFGNEKVQHTEMLKRDEFQTKMLRSFYNSALLRARIQPQELKDLMMGHDQGGARKNYDHDDETIRQAYIQAFEYLTINGIQSREDLAKIKADFHNMIGKQQVEIEERKKESEELKKSFEKQNMILVRLSSLVERQKEDINELMEMQALSSIENEIYLIENAHRWYFDQDSEIPNVPETQKIKQLLSELKELFKVGRDNIAEVRSNAVKIQKVDLDTAIEARKIANLISEKAEKLDEQLRKEIAIWEKSKQAQ